MYSLFVTLAEEAWNDRHHVFDASRCLEFTSEALKERFGTLEGAALDAIKSMPALFMYEETVGGSARVGRVIDVKRRDRDVRVSFEIDPKVPPIDPATLYDLAWDLEIQSPETTRTHWSIKDVDLMSVLQAAEAVPPGSQPPTRREILDAAKQLKNMGHTDFDRMLLEFGITTLKAGRDLGGLLARSNALGQFAVEQPGALTAEGVPISLAVVQQAAILFPQPETDIFSFAATPAPPAPPWDEEATIERSSRPMNSAHAGKPRIFVVHGRDMAAIHEVARYIERLGLEAVVLHEQPNRGRSLIAKFQEVAAGIAYAVVLMTPDDEGALKGEPPAPRSRQNVVFELGFFIGRLGADKVCALVAGDVQRPSDFESVVYVAYGEHTNWRTQLAKEFHDAGIEFDPTKVW